MVFSVHNGSLDIPSRSHVRIGKSPLHRCALYYSVYDNQWLILDVSVSSGDDFFGDEFNEEFDAMEDSDRFHDKLEDGFKNWEERHASTKDLLLECFDLQVS